MYKYRTCTSPATKYNVTLRSLSRTTAAKKDEFADSVGEFPLSIVTGSEITICISLHSLVALVNVTVFNRVIFNLYKELYVQCESLSCFA